MARTAPVSAHATMIPDEEPSVPTGTYNVTPVPSGVVTLVIIESPLPGVWTGLVFHNGNWLGAETMTIVRNSEGGYLWVNQKKGPRTGQVGAGTIRWNEDHYESEVTQGDHTGTQRTLTPM